MNPEALMKALQTMLQSLVTDSVQATPRKQVTDKELLMQLKSVKKSGTR